MALDTLRKNLTKFGDSQFDCEDLKIASSMTYFLPVSVLNQLRRDWAQAMEDEIVRATVKDKPAKADKEYPYPEKTLKFTGNVLNRYARSFYKRHGVLKIEDAAEGGANLEGEVVMTTKHCLKYQLGRCAKFPITPDPALKIPQGEKEPFYLSDGKRLFLLKFDCAKCVMEVILTDKKPAKQFEKSYRDGILNTDLKRDAPHGQKNRGGVYEKARSNASKTVRHRGRNDRPDR
jgi:putative protease